ncbi:MAG: hypothetical protein ACRDQW_01910, partial [Haloechinothrix sp.]
LGGQATGTFGPATGPFAQPQRRNQAWPWVLVAVVGVALVVMAALLLPQILPDDEPPPPSSPTTATEPEQEAPAEPTQTEEVRPPDEGETTEPAEPTETSPGDLTDTPTPDESDIPPETTDGESGVPDPGGSNPFGLGSSPHGAKQGDNEHQFDDEFGEGA